MEQPANIGQTAAAYVEKKWGGPTRLILTSNFGLGLTPGKILQNNPRRMFWMIFNLTSGAAYLWWDTSMNPSQNSIPLPPTGGSVSMSVDEDGEEVTQAVYGQSAAGATICAFEIIRK